MPIDQISEDVINEVIETNLLAVMHLTRLLLSTLRTREEAAILNVISKSGIVAQK